MANQWLLEMGAKNWGRDSLLLQKKPPHTVAAFLLFRMRLVPDGFYFFDDFGIGRAGRDDVRKFFSFNSEFLQELSVSGSRIDVVANAAPQFCTGFICYAR